MLAGILENAAGWKTIGLRAVLDVLEYYKSMMELFGENS